MLEVGMLPGVDDGIPATVGEEDLKSDPTRILISWKKKHDYRGHHAGEEYHDDQQHIGGDL